MAKLVDKERLTIKAGTYATGTAAALPDSDLLAMAKMRRRQLGQLMIPLDHAQSKTRIVPGTYLISPKIDGEFTVVVWRDGEIVSLNPYGTVRIGSTWLAETATLLQKAGIKRAVLGGELYVRFPDGKRTRVHDVCRIARAPETQAEVDMLCYAVFAIYDLDGADLSINPEGMLAKLRQILRDGDRAHLMETVAGDEKQVHALYKKWVEEGGGEGIVVRSDKVGYFKIKPRHTVDAAVIGFSEGIEDRAGMIHSLLLALVRDDGSYHVIGRTGGGTGFSEEQRIKLLKDLTPLAAPSSYTEVNSDRVAYQMIKPGLVAEISCLDIISESSDGSPIERMVIEWDAKAGSWHGVRRLPLGSIISPQFVRLRDDKTPSPADTGLTQLSRVVEVPEIATKAAEIRLAESKVLRRAVGTKELKGKTMVRKLLMWKTNKDEATPDYPAYVLLLTDFSPNRRTPLEREIRVSSSLEQIEAVWTSWVSENFVKGWTVKQDAA